MAKSKTTPIDSSLRNRTTLTGAFVIAAIALIVNANTFDHGYVLDDLSAITENWVTQKGTESLGTIWTTNYRHGYWSEPGSIYRPLTLSLFAWEWEHWPNDPRPAHIVNVVIYAITCAVLFFLLLAWFGKDRIWLAFGATFLFTLHPIHTEVVANIKSADELLATMFSFLALWFVWKNKGRNFSVWLGCALLAFFLAVSSKESVVTLIPIIPIAFYFFSDVSWRKSLMSAGWMLLPFSVYMGLRKAALGDMVGKDVVAGIDNVLVNAHVLDYYTTAIKICGLYLWKLIVPHPLSHDYSLFQIPINGLEDPLFWFALLAIAGLIYIAIKGWRSKQLFAFAIIFLFLTFSLYSNLFLTIGTHFGERLLFLPSIGYCILIAGLLWLWSTKRFTLPFELKKSALPISVLMLIGVSYGFKSFERNKDWKSEYDLYLADVENSPNSARTHYRLGMAYMKERAILAKTKEVKNQWLRKAVGELKKAIAIYPGYADAQSELGLAYQRLGYQDLAIERYQTVLDKKPTHKVTLNNMGTVLFEKGKFEKAEEFFLRAIESDPRYIDAMGNLASCYGTTGKYGEAIYWFMKAHELEPKNASYCYFIGITYQRMEKSDDATKWLERAYSLDPSLRPKAQSNN